jgi:hypothetical protein
MPAVRSGLINFDGQSLFKVIQGESFTVPDTVTTDSPTDNANFDSLRAVAGGQLYGSFSDAAGPAADAHSEIALKAGDVVACSAVVANVITVTLNGETVLLITGVTTSGGVTGLYA